MMEEIRKAQEARRRAILAGFGESGIQIHNTIEKGKKADPIGTVRNGRKKVGEGKWIVDKPGSAETRFQKKGLKRKPKAGSADKPHRKEQLAKLIAEKHGPKAGSAEKFKKEAKAAGGLAALSAKWAAEDAEMNKAYGVLFNNDSRNKIEKAFESLGILHKGPGGKEGQEGEVRTWSDGKKYKKTGGKWLPVSGDKKGGKEDGKETTNPKEKDQSSKGAKPQGGAVDSHEKAQLTHLKKVSEENPEKAYEIYQSLSPEAQAVVPQDVVNKLVENSHAEEESTDYDKLGEDDQAAIEEKLQDGGWEKIFNELGIDLPENLDDFDMDEAFDEAREALAKIITEKSEKNYDATLKKRGFTSKQINSMSAEDKAFGIDNNLKPSQFKG